MARQVLEIIESSQVAGPGLANEERVPMGIHRSAIRRRDREDAAATKIVNRDRKDKERIRRRARMIATIKAAPMPYTAQVMSWLSREIGKPTTKITQEDITAAIS